MHVNVGDDAAVYINGWVETLEPGADGLTLYIASLYWTFATLSTLGYGDIVGFTTEEYIYTMLVEVFSQKISFPYNNDSLLVCSCLLI